MPSQRSVPKVCPVCLAEFKCVPCFAEIAKYCSRACYYEDHSRIAMKAVEDKTGVPIYELLYQKYQVERKGTREIGRELGTAASTVRAWLLRLGIELRQGSEAVSLQWANNDKRRKEQAERVSQDYADGRRDRMELVRAARTPEARKRNSESKKGEKNPQSKMLGSDSPFWKGGRITEYGPGWRSIRKIVRRRDGNKCRRCESTKHLEVHHIVPYRITQDNSLENLVTLCHTCHEKVEHYGATW